LRKRSRPLLVGLGLISASRLLSVLQVLLLLRVSLLHLLCLLLVLLFDLLVSRWTSLPLCQPLVVLFLFLLEFLVVLLLLRVELFLLLVFGGMGRACGEYP
jgi:hypothetical protein